MKTQSKRIISPLFDQLRSYGFSDFGKDANAGLSVAVLLIPQGLAYAILAGMPAVYGLYAALLPVILYAIFGTSRFLEVGPVAISSILVLQGVSTLAEPFSAEYIQLVITCGFYVGLLQLLLGVFKFGPLVNFIANPVVKGFIAAASLIIIVSQLKSVFGLNIERPPSILHNIIAIGTHIEEVNWVATAIFLGSFSTMWLLKKLNKKLPRAFITVVLAIIVTKFLKLDELGVNVLGAVEKGFPSITVPTITRASFLGLLPTILTLTVVNLVESVSIGKALQDKTHQVKPNKEFIALGLSKLGGAFTSTFPTSASFSRSAIAKDAGSVSQLTGIIAAVIVLITLLFLTPLVYHLPQPTLAAIIIISVMKLFDIKTFRHLFETHRKDFLVMLATFVAALFLGIQYGILIGVILSLILVLQQSSRPQISTLGRVPGTTSFRNISVLSNLEELDGTLIIRLEDQLFFGNNEYFDEELHRLVDNHGSQITDIFLDAKSIFQVDSSGIDTLFDILDYLKENNIQLHICGGMARFRHQLSKSGITNVIGQEHIHISVHKAILQYQSDNNAT